MSGQRMLPFTKKPCAPLRRAASIASYVKSALYVITGTAAIDGVARIGRRHCSPVVSGIIMSRITSLGSDCESPFSRSVPEVNRLGSKPDRRVRRVKLFQKQFRLGCLAHMMAGWTVIQLIGGVMAQARLLVAEDHAPDGVTAQAALDLVPRPWLRRQIPAHKKCPRVQKGGGSLLGDHHGQQERSCPHRGLQPSIRPGAVPHVGWK